MTFCDRSSFQVMSTFVHSPLDNTMHAGTYPLPSDLCDGSDSQSSMEASEDCEGQGQVPWQDCFVGITEKKKNGHSKKACRDQCELLQVAGVESFIPFW